MSGAETEVVGQTAERAQEGYNAGEQILHHILDSHQIEIPLTGVVIHLPRIEIAGYDFSITRNIVMMWIAAAVLLGIAALAARRAKEIGRAHV